MMRGWRRAFCTSVPKERDNGGDSPEIHRFRQRSTSRFGLFSNPSTPGSESRSSSSSASRLRCRTWAATAVASPSPSLPDSPNLHCRTTGNGTPTKTPSRTKSPTSLLSFSFNTSSPKSPAGFSLLKSKLFFSKSSTRCGICLQRVKTGQGAANFMAECSHAFHFLCVTAGAGNQNLLAACPICGASWSESSPLSLSMSLRELGPHQNIPKPGSQPESRTREPNNKSLRIYDDDEPLISSPISLNGFNPIPESDENDEEENNGEFNGFFVNTPSPLTAKLLSDPSSRNVDVKLSTEAAIVAVGRGYETFSVAMKVKSPPFPTARGTARRSPVDVVAVMDVSGGMVGGKIQMLKRAMRLVISSLSETDRLSIVVFSSSSKRMLPLRRMTANGRRSARRIVDALAVTASGEGMNVKDAVKKAAKVIEDRREKNLSASIIVLTDRRSDPAQTAQSKDTRSPFVVSSTRISHLEIPVHTVWFESVGASNHAPPEDAFAKRVSGLLSLSVQDLTLQLELVSGSGQEEIKSVYSLSDRPAWVGSRSILLGDLYADEERELLLELKAPASSDGTHRIMTVRSYYVDPTTKEMRNSEDQALLIPRPLAIRSSNTSIAKLRSLHVSTRAVAESRRLIERNDYSAAQRMLTSARTLLTQYGLSPDDEHLHGLNAELADLNRITGRHVASKSMRNGSDHVNEKTELLTPTSAWRAAERLAKVAITRKHMNRVSDLHGFENARF